MIFKLQSNITRVKLFMHHNYFEWAPCIETFGFFAKCDYMYYLAISYLSSITSMANASPLDEEGEDDDETYCILFNNPLGIKKRGGKEKAIQGPNSKAK